MNVASRCIAFGEEKGFFPVLIDIDNDDGMTKKSAISGVDKDVTGLDFCQWTCISWESEKVLATP